MNEPKMQETRCGELLAAAKEALKELDAYLDYRLDDGLDRCSHLLRDAIAKEESKEVKE